MAAEPLWSIWDIANEIRQMQSRRLRTVEDAKLFLARIKFILSSLSPADQFELELMMKKIITPEGS